MSAIETVKFVKEVPIADADGEAIREGSVIRRIEDGATGVVVKIMRAGDYGGPFDQLGDMHIHVVPGNTIVSNNYSKWRHVPHNQQTYSQRFLSWKMRPYDHDEDGPMPKGEGFVCDGIMALLPDDSVNWENGPWPDSVQDVLGFLVDHLEGLKPEVVP